MKRYLLLFLLPLTLFGSQILSYNIYERTDRADVMLTFDTPYHGTLKLAKGKSKITLKLQDAKIEATKIKKVNSPYLHSIAITPLKNSVQIVAVVPQDVRLQASKTSDAYGLRLRFVQKSAITTQQARQSNNNDSLANLPTKKGDDLSTSYYIVVAILIIGVIILYYIKKKVQPKHPQQKKQNSSWLFNQTQMQQQAQTPPQSTTQPSNEISIRFQKQLDANNSVVMLDFLNQSYLLLIGNGNILLDKFLDNKPTTQKEFEALLQERQNELEEFLASPQQPNTQNSEPSSPLQAYKERAASLAYSDEF